MTAAILLGMEVARLKLPHLDAGPGASQKIINDNYHCLTDKINFENQNNRTNFNTLIFINRQLINIRKTRLIIMSELCFASYKIFNWLLSLIFVSVLVSEKVDW